MDMYISLYPNRLITKNNLHACISLFPFQVLPGLGKSEFFYSWTVAVYSIGEVTFALVYACLFHVVPYTYIFLSLIMSYILGSLFYAVASSGWMILIARFLVGGCCVVGESAFYVYIADREPEYEKAYAAQNDVHDADKDRKGQKLKERMYAYRVLLIGTANLIGTGTLLQYISLILLFSLCGILTNLLILYAVAVCQVIYNL